MGYQALLFCPDEKLARVVTQVFSDLEFTVEPVNEPFSAVKKLMAQRYDALVVDCENEQNATLLFKSARNSSSNQSSLALALVEGQAGVAKAYRIGANLVLTKPINVEQAKGTLRVARGLLRKTQDGAPAAAPAKPAAPVAKPAAAPAPGSTFKTQEPIAPPPATAAPEFEAPEFETALPAMAASAAIPKIPAAEPAPVAQFHSTPQAAKPAEPAKPFSQSAPAPSAKPVAGYASTAIGSAAAPALAKELPVPAEKKSMAPEFVGHAEVYVAPVHPVEVAAPSFAALEGDEAAEGGGSKKIFMTVAAVIVVTGLAYFGWTKFSAKSVPAPVQSAPVTAPTVSTPPAASVPEPVSSIPAQTSKPSAIASAPSTPSASKFESEPEVVTRKATPAPIVVKSGAASKKSGAQADDATAVPNPLAVAPANDKHISSLVASAPVNLPKAAPNMLRISQGVSQGLLIKRVQPRYPQNALSMRIQGAVQLEATIDKEGNVTNVKAQSGDPILTRAAIDAVRQWRYKPYFLDGEPVEIQTQITVNFKLPN